MNDAESAYTWCECTSRSMSLGRVESQSRCTYVYTACLFYLIFSLDCCYSTLKMDASGSSLLRFVRLPASDAKLCKHACLL